MRSNHTAFVFTALLVGALLQARPIQARPIQARPIQESPGQDKGTKPAPVRVEQKRMLRLLRILKPRIHKRPRTTRPRPVCAGLTGLPARRPMPLTGLELTYRLAAVGVRLGQARARVTPGAGALQVSLSAELTGVFAKLGFGRLTQTGRHPPDGLDGPTQVRATDARDDRTIIYHQQITSDGRSVRVTTRRSDRDRPRHRRYRRQGPLTDPVGLLLGLRARTLRVGDRACAEVIVGNRIWRLKGRVRAARDIQTPAGRIRATHIQGTAHRMRGKNKGQAFSLWLSDDAWRLPVRFWLDGPLGGLTLDLVRSNPLPGS